MPAASPSRPERGCSAPPPRQRFAVAPDAFRLGRARSRVRDYLTLYCRDRVCVDDAVLCVHEACANAVRHSGSPADIEVFLGFLGSDLRIVVRDHGQGFDTSRFDPDVLPDLLNEHGWGLFLMSRLADEIELHANGGLEVSLVKRGVLADHADARQSAPARADQAQSAQERDALQTALERAEGRFAALVDGLAEGVAVHELVERDGEVVDYRTLRVNVAFERQSGLAADQVCGRLAGELSSNGQAPRLDEYAWVVASGEPFEFETWVEETERHLRIRAVALGGDRFATLSDDVTDRRRADDDLRRAGELAGLAADERRRAEEQRAHVAAELRRLADESAAAGGELRDREEALRGREGRLRAGEEALAAREERLWADDEALQARAAELEARHEALRSREAALADAPVAASVPPLGQPHGGGEAQELAERVGLHEERELAERVGLGEELDVIDRVLCSALDTDDMMQRVLDLGVATLHADAGTVELRDDDTWVVRCQSGVGPEIVGTRLEGQQAPNALRALRYREPYATADMQAARSAVGFVAEQGLRAVLAVPLLARDEVIGCLLFYDRQVRVFDDPEIDFGRKLGATLALAIDNARLRDEPDGV